MKVVVSIIICTRNRADSLRETLLSIGRCELPADLRAELLVVDNGSTDHTRQVVEQAGLTNLPVRYIHEPTKGLSNARNRGMAEARGDIFLWTDDDVRVPTDWIEGMCRPIAAGGADAVAGGVSFPPDREALLTTEPLHTRRGWFAAVDGISETDPERMVGANMCFSRIAWELAGPFDTALGPGALGFYDETFFCYRLRSGGQRLVTRFSCLVEHHFDPSRVTRAHLLRIAQGMGASAGYLAWHWRGVLPPRRITLLRAHVGLAIRRMARPWVVLSSTAPGWELHRVQAIAYFQQLRRESRHPARYASVRSPEGGVTCPV